MGIEQIQKLVKRSYPEFEDFKPLIDGVLSYNPHADSVKIKKACIVAHEAHKHQKRASGQPYFIHCYEVGKILAALHMDSHSIIAGILHDVIEDTDLGEDFVKEEFDEETAELVKSVTKLEHSAIENLEFLDEEDKRAENIRKVLLATSKDVRVIIIKLADRLHNMRTLKHLNQDKQKVIAQETLEIYAPIAQKLGINAIKAELEDLSFRYLDNKSYTDFKNKINKKREQREREVAEIMDHVKDDLHLNKIEAKVQGRAKHFYSIFKKIAFRHKEFNEIYDLIAIRIITKNIKDCYSALGIVHERWKPMPGKFKDYIAVPKSNGYQSLHTTVMGSHGRILEVQIRTEDMHLAAEQGIAAHWRYKGTESDKKFDRQIGWLKQILDWRRHSGDAKEFIENMKVDLFEKEIFVFTPQGDPLCLPEKATPVDFAYAVHTDIGNHCSKAKVNGKIATLDTELSSGDIVEIITQKIGKPSRSWLGFVKSASARSKIKNTLKIKTHLDPKQRREEEKKKDDSDLKNMNVMVNEKKYQIKISKCCNPKISDDIIGFKTKDGKIAIHKKSCDNVHLYEKHKQIDVSLKNIKPETIHLMISLKDQIGAIAKVLSIVSEEHQKIVEVNTKSGKNNIIIMRLEILKSDYNINDLLAHFKTLDQVLSAQIENY
jgi:guanosine-3',5'-bis(diphosphate) 3'-pyrophosphohydrolase